jgi:Phosphopantetheine attachment site
VSIRLTIFSQIEQIAAEQKIKIQPLRDDLLLSESGLDSLCFAILVARLEDKFGYDPFATSSDAGFPVTLGDFVRFYENAAG